MCVGVGHLNFCECGCLQSEHESLTSPFPYAEALWGKCHGNKYDVESPQTPIDNYTPEHKITPCMCQRFKPLFTEYTCRMP